VGMNAVMRDPKAIRAKAARSGFRLPVRSAVMAKRTPRRDAARTPANMRLIWPSVRSKDNLTNGSVWAIWLAAYAATKPMRETRSTIRLSDGRNEAARDWLSGTP